MLVFSIVMLLISCTIPTDDKKENLGNIGQKPSDTIFNQGQHSQKEQFSNLHHNGETTSQKKAPKFAPVQQGQQRQGQQGFHATVDFQLVEALQQGQKSIIWISLDTVHAKRMSVYGGRAKVPNIEKLSTNAVVFDTAISHFPETAMSHWSMMTSVLPEVHGNIPANGGSAYTGPTIAEITKKMGYATGAVIGGVTMTDQASGFSRGFDFYDDKFPLKKEDMSRNGMEVTERGLAWISTHKQNTQTSLQPFFLFAHYFDAHFPYTPTKNLYDPTYNGTIDGTDAVLRPYRDGEKQPSNRDIEHVLALYDAEITELDEKIAPLLALASEDVVVVITADHGESFSHEYYFNHRGGLWEEILHVPAIIAGGGIKGTIHIQHTVGLIDIAPTVLDIAGLPKDKRMQGNSVHGEIFQSTNTSLSPMVFSITDPWMPNPQFAVRTNRYKYIEKRQLHKDFSVFDLQEDTMETRSLSTIPSEITHAIPQYQSAIDTLEQYQANIPQKRIISDDECKRLMALGYTTCQ